jgi:radical SAM protein with 4Fe4S-binding SPASM domain
MTGDNIAHMEGIVDLAYNLGISQVRVVPVQSFPTNPILLKYFKSETNEALETISKKAVDYNIQLQLGFAPFKEFIVEGKTYNPCCHPWLYALFNYEGNIRPCEHMLGNSDMNISIGNIKEISYEWWNGDEMKSFRNAHKAIDLDGMPKKCNKCYTMGRYADHEQDIYQNFQRWNFNEKDILRVVNENRCQEDRN